MSHDISHVYQALLSKATVALLMQRRIFDHAVRVKDNALLVELAEYAHLDPTIDLLLADVDAVSVKNAWIRRAGRTTDEIINLVSAEKRSSVLTSITSIPGLPEEVYTKMLDKARGINLYRAIASSHTAPDATRIEAARHWVRKDQHKRELDTVTAEAITAGNVLGDLATQLIDGDDSLVMYLANMAADSDITPVQQHRFLDVYVETFTSYFEAQPTKRQWVAGIHERVVRWFAECTETDTEGLERLQDFTDSLIKKTARNEQWVKRQLENCAAVIKTATPTATRSATFSLEGAITAEDLDRKIDNLLNRYSRDGLTQRQRRSFIMATLTHPACNGTHTKRVTALTDWWELRELVGHAGLPAGRVADVLVHNPYVDLSDAIGKRTDGREVIIALLGRRKAGEDLSHLNDIVATEHLDQQLFEMLPAAQFLGEVTFYDYERALPMLHSYLESIPAGEAWSSFEALAPDFEGTLGELHAVVSKI